MDSNMLHWHEPSQRVCLLQVESRTASTKYAIPEKATSNVGKALQAYGKYSRIQRWGRKCVSDASNTVFW